MIALDVTNRSDIHPGLEVLIVKKEEQGTGKLTAGTAMEILANSGHHPRGIKVRPVNGEVRRVHHTLHGGKNIKLLFCSSR